MKHIGMKQRKCTKWKEIWEPTQNQPCSGQPSSTLCFLDTTSGAAAEKEAGDSEERREATAEADVHHLRTRLQRTDLRLYAPPCVGGWRLSHGARSDNSGTAMRFHEF